MRRRRRWICKQAHEKEGDKKVVNGWAKQANQKLWIQDCGFWVSKPNCGFFFSFLLHPLSRWRAKQAWRISSAPWWSWHPIYNTTQHHRLLRLPTFWTTQVNHGIIEAAAVATSAAKPGWRKSVVPKLRSFRLSLPPQAPLLSTNLTRTTCLVPLYFYVLYTHSICCWLWQTHAHRNRFSMAQFGHFDMRCCNSAHFYGNEIQRMES